MFAVVSSVLVLVPGALPARAQDVQTMQTNPDKALPTLVIGEDSRLTVTPG